MSMLDQVIDDAASNDVPITSLLRKLLAVGHRLRSEEMQQWAKAELGGFPRDDEDRLPQYRSKHLVAVRGLFDGPGTRDVLVYQPVEIPDVELREALFYESFYQPIAELETLTQSKQDPQTSVATAVVVRLRQLQEQNKVPGLAWPYVLNEVRRVVPHSTVVGILDQVRTAALNLALGLQGGLPVGAGEAGGPTVNDDQNVATTVSHVLIQNIYGDHANLAVGQNVNQNVTVSHGDKDALLQRLAELGLEEAALNEAEAAIAEDGATPGEKTRSFLQKLKNGTYKVGTGVATNVGTRLATDAVLQYFGFPG